MVQSGAERIFGHRAEEVIGQSVTLLMPERYRELCVAGLHRYLRTGEARVVGGTTELVGLRKTAASSRSRCPSVKPSRMEERLFTGVIRDITERRRTEDALRETRDRFRSIFDHAPIGVAMVSLEGRYLQVNGSLARYSGTSRKSYKPSRGRRSPTLTIWQPVRLMRAGLWKASSPSTTWRSAFSTLMATRCGLR